jgi:predicted small lipoprotein YifL
MSAPARLAGTALLIATLLAGCGQKGPLYLPAKPKAKVPAATSAPTPASPAAASPSTTPQSQP